VELGLNKAKQPSFLAKSSDFFVIYSWGSASLHPAVAGLRAHRPLGLYSQRALPLPPSARLLFVDTGNSAEDYTVTSVDTVRDFFRFLTNNYDEEPPPDRRRTRRSWNNT
jgi:hypothetical protein